MRSNIPALTSLRFFAAGVVVLTHLIKSEAFHNTWYGRVLMAGPEAVVFFFVLSGFIMTYVYHGDNEANPTINSYKFWKARFARIYPAYILGLVIAMPNVLYMAYVSKLITVPNMVISSTLSLFMVQGWSPTYNWGPNGPGWSLTVEMMFYALFPMLLVLTSKIEKWSFAFITAALLVLTFGIKSVLIKPDNVSDYMWQVDYLYKLPVNYIATFMAGMAVGRIYLFADRLSVTTHNVMFACGSLLLLVVTAFVNIELEYSTIAIVPITCIIVYGGANTSYKLLNWKPLVILGEASYALYILHAPILTLMSLTAKMLHVDVHSIMFGTIAGLSTVILSVLCFVYYERTMRNKILSSLSKVCYGLRLEH